MVRLIGLAAIACALVAGCGDDEADHAAGSTPTQNPADLHHQTFVATALSENGEELPILPVREALDLPTGTRIMVVFDLHEPDVLSWAGGCNETWSDLQVTDERLMVEDKFGSTLVGCEDPLGEQELWLTHFLLSDPQWTLDGDRLTLLSGDSTIELLRIDEAK